MTDTCQAPEQMHRTMTGNCGTCWHLWSKHGPDGCTAKVYPSHSLQGEPCPCENPATEKREAGMDDTEREMS